MKVKNNINASKTAQLSFNIFDQILILNDYKISFCCLNYNAELHSKIPPLL